MTKTLLICTFGPLFCLAAELPDISSIPADLTVPALTEKAPAPGLRVKHHLPGYASSIYHVLYLPTDWQKDAQMPLIVEFAGNGGYKNKYGDVSPDARRAATSATASPLEKARSGSVCPI